MRILLVVSLACAAVLGVAAPASAEEEPDGPVTLLCYEVDAAGLVNLHPTPTCLPLPGDCASTTHGVPNVQEVTLGFCLPD